MLTLATRHDIPGLVGLCENFIEEFSLPPGDQAKIEAMLNWHLEHGFLVTAMKNGDIIGVLALHPETYWYSDEQFVTDTVFYVHPRGRKSRAAQMLMEAGKEYAKELGLPMMLAVSSGGNVEKKDRFYERKGFSRIGGVFYRGVN